MDYEVINQQEAERIQQEQRRLDEERKRREEQQRQQVAMQSQPAPAQTPQMGGFDPSSMMGMMGGSGAGGAGAGGASSAGGAASSGMSAWPVAVAALAIGQHQWAKRKGLHDDKDAITGRALLKDSEYYQKKGNEKVSGLGDEMRLAALGSSPADLFRKDTWSSAAKLAAKGGILGGLLKKIF